jgi:hypothetical protein
MLTPIIILIILTIIFIVIESVFFETKTINYIDNFWLASAFYLIYSLIIFFFFREFSEKFLNNNNLIPLFFLAIFYSINIILFRYVRIKYSDVITRIYAINPKQKIITFNNRFLFSKSCQIAAQQVLLLTFVSIMIAYDLDRYMCVLICGLCFAAVHLFGLIKWGKVFGIYLITCSLFLGFIATYMIAFVPFGLVYSFIIHWLFYIISTLLVVKFYNNKPLRKYMLRFILQV